MLACLCKKCFENTHKNLKLLWLDWLFLTTRSKIAHAKSNENMQFYGILDVNKYLAVLLAQQVYTVAILHFLATKM